MSDVLLFDMDGVFLVGPGTAPGVYRAAAHDALREFGIRATPDTAPTLEATHYDPAMADACATLGVDHDAWWAARERHASRRTNARIRAGDRGVYDDAWTVRELLESDGPRVGLVSNNRRATTEFVADYLFDGAFEAVVGREPTVEDYARRKPEPDLVERGLDALDADRGYYVGDRETDLIAAERAGLTGVFLDRPHNDRDALSVEPDHAIASLSELDRVVGL